MIKSAQQRILLSAVVVAMLAVSCGEKEVPFIIDADELSSYINSSPEAVQLFSVKEFFPGTPYQVSHMNATYQDNLLEHKRAITVETVPLAAPDSIRNADYGNLGRFREAWAIVHDEFTVETIRIFASDTLVDTTDRTMRRYGFFLKLGDDSRDYVGWVLWGYRGMFEVDPPLRSVIIARVDGEVTRLEGDVLLYNELPRSHRSWFRSVAFIKLSNIPKIDNGEALALETNWIGGLTITKRDYPIVTFDGEGGFTTIAPNQISREEYRGVADIRNGSTRRYNMLFIQAFHDDEFFHTVSWTVPYQL